MRAPKASWWWVALAALFSAGCPSCIDEDAGRHYACDRSAGNVESQCPGDWVCTLDGVCADPGRGQEWQCQASSDCTGGWHCGPGGTCYDRADAGAVACRLDQPEDCGPDWTCGLEGVCHPTAQGGPYRCDGDDRWCTAGWRCGGENLCVDTTLTRLRDAPDPASLSRSRLGPGYDPSTVRTFGVSLGTERTLQRFAVATDGGILHAQAELSTASTEALASSAGWIPQAELAGPATSLAAVGSEAYAVAGGTLYRFGFDPNGSTWLEGEGAAFQVQGLDELRQAVVVFATDGGAEFRFRSRNDGGSGSLNQDGWPILEVAGFVDPKSDSANPFLASTDGGLLISELSDLDPSDGGPGFPSAWMPLTLPGVSHADCGGAAPVPARMLRALTVEPFRLLGFVQGEEVSIFHTDGPPAPAACSSSGFMRTFGPVRICPEGASVEQFGFFGGQQQTLLPYARCLEDSGVRSVWSLREDGGVSREADLESQLGTGDLKWSATNSSSQVAMNASGGLLQCSETTQRGPCQQLTLSGGADFVIGTATGRLVAQRGGETFENVPGFHLVHRAQSTLCGAASGVATAALEHAHIEGVTGVRVTDLENPGSTLGFVPDPLPFDSKHPPLATVAPTMDGGQIWVVSVEEAIWSGPGLELDSRSVPVLNESVTGLAFPDTLAPDAGVYTEGYAIAQERVFRLRASSPNQWRTSELSLPAGVALTVWFDGDRGRVGYADGRVFSLPDGAQLGPALEGVLGFAELCGHGYVLTAEGLNQLSNHPAGEPIGVWREVPLEGLGLPAEDRFFEHEGQTGSLHASGDELFVVNARGMVVVLRDPACP